MTSILVYCSCAVRRGQSDYLKKDKGHQVIRRLKVLLSKGKWRKKLIPLILIQNHSRTLNNSENLFLIYYSEQIDNKQVIVIYYSFGL